MGENSILGFENFHEQNNLSIFFLKYSGRC